jgi:hypothetical protein
MNILMFTSWGESGFLGLAQVLDGLSYKRLSDAWPSFR